MPHPFDGAGSFIVGYRYYLSQLSDLGGLIREQLRSESGPQSAHLGHVTVSSVFLPIAGQTIYKPIGSIIPSLSRLFLWVASFHTNWHFVHKSPATDRKISSSMCQHNMVCVCIQQRFIGFWKDAMYLVAGEWKEERVVIRFVTFGSTDLCVRKTKHQTIQKSGHLSNIFINICKPGGRVISHLESMTRISTPAPDERCNLLNQAFSEYII